MLQRSPPPDVLAQWRGIEAGDKRVTIAQEIAAETAQDGVGPEDAARAQIYRLLAGLLGTAPGAQALHAISSLHGDQTPLGMAVSRLAGEASGAVEEQLSTEYQQLFIGLGRGELVPYASYYLTGFLHEKPLARLREVMDRLGVARNDGVVEPEDHIASVLELMAGLVDGSLAPGLDEAEHLRFFEAHVGAWAPYFFRDLAASRTSLFYAAVGVVGSEFMTVEQRAFEIM